MSRKGAAFNLNQMQPLTTPLMYVQEVTPTSILKKIIWTGRDTVSRSLPKVVLVTYPDIFTMEEAKTLVESADRQIVQIFTQKYLNHSQYGMGSGKADEIKDFIKGTDVEQIIVDDHLTSKQMHNLEKLTGVQVIDRDRLVLDIFYSRAFTVEAKLQIELAEIKYEMPRVRENAKMSSGNERQGKGGMGEYVVDVKFRDMKRRMSFIKAKLRDAQQKRHLYQNQRLKSSMPIVSLVGYTSSGKTTLFNLLTQEDKPTSASLFTTLSTTTRALKSGNREILLTDTVGFISRLPTYMVDAFRSTLEESLGANLILLLIDASEEIQSIRIKYNTCYRVLEELKADHSRIQVVLTKYDKIKNQEKIKQIAEELDITNPIVISTKKEFGINRLKTLINQHPLTMHPKST